MINKPFSLCPMGIEIDDIPMLSVIRTIIRVPCDSVSLICEEGGGEPLMLFRFRTHYIEVVVAGNARPRHEIINNNRDKSFHATWWRNVKLKKAQETNTDDSR